MVLEEGGDFRNEGLSLFGGHGWVLEQKRSVDCRTQRSVTAVRLQHGRGPGSAQGLWLGSIGTRSYGAKTMELGGLGGQEGRDWGELGLEARLVASRRARIQDVA